MEFPAEFSKSDDLTWLQRLLEQYPAIASLNQFVRVHVIVDANAVFEAILWSLRRARKKNARPALLELLEAEAINCFAPTFLPKEIVSIIHKRATRYKYSVKLALKIWAKYEVKIQLVDVGEPPRLVETAGDPKDVPYLKLQEKLKFSIVSDDQHISDMGGNSVNSTVFLSLRKYSRESATVVKLNILGLFSATIPVMALTQSVALIQKSISRAAKRFPQWIWVAAAFLVAILMLNPKNREWLVHRIASCKESIQKAALGMINALEPFFEEHQRSSNAAREALSEANEKGLVLKCRMEGKWRDTVD